jgi:hypothetical protein
MTCLAIDTDHSVNAPDSWDAVRAAVFWGFILAVIVSPAVLGAMILLAA